MKKSALLVLVGFVLGVAACGGAYLWDRTTNLAPSAQLPDSRIVAKEKTETLECRPVVVYRDRVKEKLALPDTDKRDTAKHVTAAADIPGDDRPRTVSALYDERLGTTDLYIREAPLPWLATISKHELGLAYGLTDDGTAARLYGRADFLQIKAARLGVIGNVDSSGRWFAGVGGAVRW